MGLLLAIPHEKLLLWAGALKTRFKTCRIDRYVIEGFIEGYYVDRLIGEGILPPDMKGNVSVLARDYARVCLMNEEPISLRSRSMENLERAHNDRMANLMERVDPASSRDREKEFALPLLPENSRFAELRKLLPDEFVLIDTVGDLFREGVEQHNCVFSYRGNIQRDESAIYHWDTDGRHYTIEFGKGNAGYVIKQMRQRYNQMPLPEDLAKVSGYVNKSPPEKP